MTIDKFIEILKTWVFKKVSGVVTIIIHEGGIRKVKIEKEVK